MFLLVDDVLFIIFEIIGPYKTAKLAKLNSATCRRLQSHPYWSAFIHGKITRMESLKLQETVELIGDDSDKTYLDRKGDYVCLRDTRLDLYSQATLWIYGQKNEGSRICACGNYLGLNNDWIYNMESKKYCTVCTQSYVRGPCHKPDNISPDKITRIKPGVLCLWQALRKKDLLMDKLSLHGNCNKDWLVMVICLDCSNTWHMIPADWNNVFDKAAFFTNKDLLSQTENYADLL